MPFKVGADWGAGAYAVALTHRPLDVKAKRMPGRAMGLAWFSIDEGAHKLDVAIDAPDKTRPRQSLTLPIKIGGLSAGEEAEVTVAAVDVGILNLTGYKTPDPRGYFFGQRKLAVDIRDLYWHADRRHGGRRRRAADRRRQQRQSRRQSADPTAARALFRRRQGRRRRRGQRRVRHSRLQRLGQGDGGRVVEDQGRLGRGGRDRARSRRRHRDAAALPRPRRPLADACRHRQCRGRSRRLPARSRHSRAADRRGRRADPDGEARRASARLGHDADRRRRGRDRDARPEDHRARPIRDPAIPARRRGWRARHLSPHDRAVAARRQQDDLRRSRRRLRSRHRVGLGRGFAVRRARRAGAAAGARTLPLRLLRADGQPRHAAALRQPARRARTSRASTRISTGA